MIKNKIFRAAVWAVFVLVASLASFAADDLSGYAVKPNLERIEKETTNPESQYFFPKLMARYEAADTTMTLDEISMVYYGWAFQNSYTPFSIGGKKGKRVKALIDQPTLSAADAELAMALTDTLLMKNPFDSSTLIQRIELCEKIGNKEEADKCSWKLMAIVTAVRHSGHGVSEATAYYVTNTQHEYLILSTLDLRPVSQSLEGMCDYLTVEANPMNLPGVYFNVELPFTSVQRRLSKTAK